METHVCEDVHTEFILSSCYSFHQAVSMLDREQSKAVEKNAVWHSDYTIGAGLAQEVSR